ncbi:hypothetical protein GCM10010431_39670 [Streptomyces kunmingensis]
MRSNTGWRARTYDANDGYAECAACADCAECVAEAAEAERVVAAGCAAGTGCAGCVAAGLRVTGFDALVQTGARVAVMAPRYERPLLLGIGRRSRSDLRLRLYEGWYPHLLKVEEGGEGSWGFSPEKRAPSTRSEGRSEGPSEDAARGPGARPAVARFIRYVPQGRAPGSGR